MAEHVIKSEETQFRKRYTLL